MSRHQHILERAPMGMASSTDLGALPEGRAQLIEGAFPARNNQLQNFPQYRSAWDPNTVAGGEWNWPIITLAFFQGKVSPRDDVLVFHASNQGIYVAPTNYLEALVSAPQTYRIPLPSLVGYLPPLSPDWQGPGFPRIRTVQYEDELIIVREGGIPPYRFTYEYPNATYTDGTAIEGSRTYNCTANEFTAAHVGKEIRGLFIPDSTIIVQYVGPTQVVLSQPLAGSGGSLTFTIVAGATVARLFKSGMPTPEGFYFTKSVTTTNGSTTITAVSGILCTESNIGSLVTGTGIPAGATIVSQTATACVISIAATATATVTVTVHNALYYGGIGGDGASAGTFLTASRRKLVLVWVDEKGRRSSPSVYATSLAATLYNTPFTFDVPAVNAANPDTGIRYYEIYSTEQDGSVYYRLLGPTAATQGTTVTVSETSLDAFLDSGLDFSTIGPNYGTNDNLQPATLHTECKGRLDFDSTVKRNSLQVSNLSDPTARSSTSSPLNDADLTLGTVLAVGNDEGDEITGLCRFGALLGVAKRRSYHLMSGDDLSQFHVRPAHNRGCESHDTFIRCDLDVPMLSSDGVYSLAYQDGFSPKLLSGEISDQFWGTYPERPSMPSGPTRSMDSVKSRSFAWYWQNRYFLALGSYVYVYDFQGGEQAGWSRTALNVQHAIVVKQSGRPDTVFMAVGFDNEFWPTDPRGFLVHFHAAMKDDHTKNQPGTTSPYVRMRVVGRPADGAGVPRERRKRLKRVTVFGSTDFYGNQDTPMAQCVLTDVVSGQSETFTATRWPGLYPDGVLFSYEPKAGFVGRLPVLDYTLLACNTTVTDTLFEYHRYD